MGRDARGSSSQGEGYGGNNSFGDVFSELFPEDYGAGEVDEKAQNRKKKRIKKTKEDYVQVWKCRKKHFIIWFVLITLGQGVYFFLNFGKFSIADSVMRAAVAYLYALWILVPFTSYKTELGIRDLEKQEKEEMKARQAARNARQSGGYSRERNGTGLEFETRTYDLNNQGDAMEFGAHVCFVILSVLTAGIFLLFVVAKKLFSSAGDEARVLGKWIRRVVGYLYVMIPLPITTPYYYIRSREKLTLKNIGIPIVAILIFSMIIWIAQSVYMKEIGIY